MAISPSSSSTYGWISTLEHIDPRAVSRPEVLASFSAVFHPGLPAGLLPPAASSPLATPCSWSNLPPSRPRKAVVVVVGLDQRFVGVRPLMGDVASP